MHVMENEAICIRHEPKGLPCWSAVASRALFVSRGLTVQSSTATETKPGYAANNMFIMPTKNSQLANTCEHF